MSMIAVILALILAVTLVAALARAVPVPLPLLLIAAGVVLSAAPSFSRVHIDPETFFVLFIPPLLFADGWLMPRRDFKTVLRPVLLLAFGLVLATVVVVGYALHALIPSLPLAAAFALGAIVSPTDAVATAAMTERLPLPSRVTLILNGESLINDASGLVAFKFAVAALATGAFSLWEAGGQLVIVAAGGGAIGLAIAFLVGRMRRSLHCVGGEMPTVQTLLSLLTPFAAYLAAEHVGASGILAVVASGLLSGFIDARRMSVTTRQHAWQVWLMVLFVFNGLVFLLLGLSLPPAIQALAPTQSWLDLALHAGALWAIVTAIRLLWVYPGTYLPPLLFASVRASEPPRDPRAVFVIGWAGLRGSVTMAAALSLPVALPTGAPFPGREEIVFLSATTILLTLLINGLTLPPLIRWLRLRGDGAAGRELRAAEIALAQAAAARLSRELPHLATAEEREFAQRLIGDYEGRIALHTANERRRDELAQVADGHRRIVLLALEAERGELASLRDQDVINDETARAIEPRIDHAELYATNATAAERGH
ncbi:MAG: Na+/H+ antiporter [Burkholderiales bacterium]